MLFLESSRQRTQSAGPRGLALGVVEDAPYAPMLSRIYASKHCKHILYDEKALELEGKLPPCHTDASLESIRMSTASARRERPSVPAGLPSHAQSDQP